MEIVGQVLGGAMFLFAIAMAGYAVGRSDAEEVTKIIFYNPNYVEAEQLPELAHIAYVPAQQLNPNPSVYVVEL